MPYIIAAIVFIILLLLAFRSGELGKREDKGFNEAFEREFKKEGE